MSPDSGGGGHGTARDARVTTTGPRAGRRVAGVRALGYLVYVGVLSAGYYYNLTFVQLGLIDLGTRRVGMPEGQVSAAMAALAVVAFAAAVVTGRAMDVRGWSADLRVKLRILFFVVAAQTILTMAAPHVATPGQFALWVLVSAVGIGAGIPATFSLMVDFIPVRHRGYVAALVTALAFSAAALYPLEWRIEDFAPPMSLLMLPAAAVLGLVSFRRFPVVDELARQHERFGVGRFCRPTTVATASVGFWMLVLVMFAVFFIDSLGFLRIIDTPAYISTSWQSPTIGPRLFIAGTHVVGAAMAGVLYTAFGRRWLLVWVFGLFAFTHLLYTFDLGTSPAGVDPPLALPLFYVLAVSFYTTLNFALWPDLSTPATVGTNTALGVGIAGWLASFVSTSLALYSRSSGVSLLEHLRYVNALALLFAVAYPLVLYVRRMRALAANPEPP
jgi:MFS family permease